jgi:hypothetical protein
MLSWGLEATEAMWNLNEFPGSEESQFLVVATDGVRSAGAVSDAIAIPGKPPTVIILEPENGAILQAGQPVSLVGRPIDLSGQSLPPDGLEWWVDGEKVGHDSEAGLIPAPKPGEHTVELKLAAGKERAEARIRFSVAEPTQDDLRYQWIIGGREGNGPKRGAPTGPPQDATS